MQAILVASSLAILSLLLPPISIVSSAAVALVTLRRGSNEGLFVLICSCISAALLGLILFGNYNFALIYGLVLWLPIWLISIVLREGKHLSFAVESAVLLGVACIIFFYLYVGEPAVFWHSMLSEMIQPMQQMGGSEVPIEKIKQSVKLFSHFMTGGIAAGTIYGLLFSLFLARWWQSALFNPGGFRAEYLSLRVQPWIALASVIIVAIASVMTGKISEIGWNIAIIFVVLYTFIGTSILHTVFASMKFRRFMVPFLYLTLVLIPHTVIVVVIIGLLDTWLDLRSKISNKTGT